MAPIKARFLPMRNQAGKFTKTCINSAGTSPRMKTHGASSVSKAKYRRRRTLEQPRIGKKTSVVWNFFRSLPYENGISRAICLLCKVVFKNPGGSTTGMRGHLDRKHPGVVDQVLDAQKYKPSTTSGGCSSKDIKLKNEARRSVSPSPPPLSIGAIGETEIFEQDTISDIDGASHQPINSRHHILPGPPPEVYTITDADTEDISKSVVHYLAANMHSLNSVKDTRFREMIYNLNSIYLGKFDRAESSMVDSLSTTLNEMYQDMKEDFRRILHDQSICLSLDLWVKTNAEVYLLVTANFIDCEWNFQCSFLGVRNLPETTLRTSMDTLYSTVETHLRTIIEDCDIKPDQIVNIVFNAFPFKQENPKQMLSLRVTPCFNEVLRHSYDILNETVKSICSCDMLEDVQKVGKKYLAEYKDMKRHPGKLMESIKRLLSTASEGEVPFHSTLEDIDAYIKMQEPLNDVVESLMDESVLAASTILTLMYGIRNFFDLQVDINSKWNAEQKSKISAAICQYMQTSYNFDMESDDLGNTSLAICSFFDPRYKNLQFLTTEQRQLIHDTVMELLHEQEKTRTAGLETGSIISVRSENPNYKKINENRSLDPLNMSPSTPNTSSNNSKLALMLNKIMGRKMTPTPNSQSLEELTNYIREPDPSFAMDPYQWWKYNYDKYPTLSAIARKYLCIRGIASATRLIFTLAGKKTYNSFGNVEEEYLDKLLCLKRYQATIKDQDVFSDSTSYCQQIVLEDELDIKTEMAVAVQHELIDED